MVADANPNVTYMNPAVMDLLKEAEADLKRNRRSSALRP